MMWISFKKGVMHRFVHSLPFYFHQRTIASLAVIPVIHRPVPKTERLVDEIGDAVCMFWDKSGKGAI